MFAHQVNLLKTVSCMPDAFAICYGYVHVARVAQAYWVNLHNNYPVQRRVTLQMLG